MSSKKLMSAATSSYSKSTSDYFGTTSMLKTLHTRLRAFVVFASKVWTFICYVFRKQTRAVRSSKYWFSVWHFYIFELIYIFFVKKIHNHFGAFMAFSSKIWLFVLFVCKKQTRRVRIYTCTWWLSVMIQCLALRETDFVNSVCLT